MTDNSTGDSSMRVTPFTFDRTINLPFLVTVVLAIAAGAAWTSKMDNRMTNVEVSTAGLPEMRERLARMDERGENTKAAIARIEGALAAEGPRQ